MSTVSRVLEFEPPIDAEASVTRLLHALGEDPSREGLRRTPERVAKALEFLTSGRRLSPRDVLNGAVFNEAYEGMVLVKDIEFYSLCEHHLLPFHGRAHVAYLPAGKVIGLSKIPRLLEVFSRRLQVQERLTEQTAQALAEVLEPRGVAVMLEAVHFCMMMRGVEKQRSATSTFAYRGRFDSSPELRAEFLAAVREAEPVWESALRAGPTGGRHIELTAESRPEHVGRARGASRRAFRSAPGRPRGHRCGLCPAP